MNSFMEQSFRQMTPPAGPDAYYAGSSSCSPPCYWEPEEVDFQYIETPGTTPPRSPPRVCGPTLLPRIRNQESDYDLAPMPMKHRKSRASSSGPSLGYAASVAHPALFRRSVSPAVGLGLSSAGGYSKSRAASVPPVNSSNYLQCPSLAHSRSTSISSAHSRSSSINSCALGIYPSQSYGQPKARSSSLANVMAHAEMPTLNLPSTQAAPVTPAPQQDRLAPELLFDNYAEMPDATSLLDFLTAPNPTPSLVRRLNQPNRLHDTHFWWDVRNIRTWDDFKLETIHSIPGLTSLLTHEIPAPALPKPGNAITNPETTSSLHDGYASFYSTKVNGALKVALGNSYPAMTSNKAAATPANPRGAPADFTAHYIADHERTLFGEQKGRVVGLVRAFDQWNSGMRTSEKPTARIEFMRELACLHRHMRDHGCRYGFIMTEIELVCVRAGTDNVPYFGYLELAPAIQLSTHGKDKLTACLALWYLHMLAKNTPLTGQAGWKMDVGHPGSLTRQHCLERDVIPFKPEGREKRDAKRNRGWVLPEDPLSKKECGRQRKYNRAG